MIINGKALIRAAPIREMISGKRYYRGFSWGLTECGYDIRVKQDVWMFLGRRFVLASSIEYFDLPTNLMGRVLNKSSWARLGVDASMTTNIEPGWQGHLTLELRYSGVLPLLIPAGVGIAQVIFESLSELAKYNGKYQNQGDRPVSAIIT
jgi:dCTP deaminase